MKKFSGVRTFDEIMAQCLDQGVLIDLRPYERGADYVILGRTGHGHVLFMPHSGAFFGTTPDGRHFSSDSERYENEPWFVALLNFFYVS